MHSEHITCASALIRPRAGAPGPDRANACLYAELDTKVSPGVSIPLVEYALKIADNDDYTIHTFEKSNHWFAQAEIGTTIEMRELIQQSGLDHYEFVPGFLEMIGDWIIAQASS